MLIIHQKSNDIKATDTIIYLFIKIQSLSVYMNVCICILMHILHLVKRTMAMHSRHT